MARHALIMACPTAVTGEQRKLAKSKVDRFADGWVGTLSNLGEHSFAWPGSKKPSVLIEPTRGKFLDTLDDAIFGDDDELLLVFLGHSYPVGASNVAPSFEKANTTDLNSHDFVWLFDQLFSKGLSKVYGILDCCHIGRFRFDITKHRENIFLMLGATDGYSYGDFQEAMLHGLQSADSETISYLTDKRASGVTLSRLFEYAVEKMARGDSINSPISVGDLGETVIRMESTEVAQPFNSRSPSNSVYRRCFELIKILAAGKQSIPEIMDEVRANSAFLLDSGDMEGKKKYMTADGVLRYLKFFISIKWLARSDNVYTVLEDGKKAGSAVEFNAVLVASIVEHLLPEKVDLDTFRDTLYHLMKEGIPPDAFELGRHLRQNGLGGIDQPENLKFAFKVLPYSQAFRRSTEALYPM